MTLIPKQMRIHHTSVYNVSIFKGCKIKEIALLILLSLVSSCTKNPVDDGNYFPHLFIPVPILILHGVLTVKPLSFTE